MKLKVLMVADTYFPKVDGIVRFMQEFLKKSSPELEVSLLVPRLGEKKDNPKVIEIETSSYSLSGYPSIKRSKENLTKIKAAVQAADLVFVQGPALLSYYAIKYAHRSKKRVVAYVHVIPWELFSKFLPRYLGFALNGVIRKTAIHFYEKCDLLLVPYPELAIQLRRAGVSTRIKTAQLGVDIETFAPSVNKSRAKQNIGITPGKFVIGYVGRISKEKNVRVLRQAFQKLSYPRKHLLLVGDGPEDQKKEFQDLNSCTITGFVDNVHDYLQAMDIFVMPSLTETTSLATLEAMATGLPVISSKIGFIKEYLIKDYNGQFFPSKNPGILVIKIEQLMENPALREKLGSNARKTVAYSFSWERSINRIKRLILTEFYP